MPCPIGRGLGSGPVSMTGAPPPPTDARTTAIRSPRSVALGPVQGLHTMETGDRHRPPDRLHWPHVLPPTAYYYRGSLTWRSTKPLENQRVISYVDNFHLLQYR